MDREALNVAVLCASLMQSGLTALHLAAQEDKVAVAEILTRNGANLDQQTKVSTIILFSLSACPAALASCGHVYICNNICSLFYSCLHICDLLSFCSWATLR